jgi:transposase
MLGRRERRQPELFVAGSLGDLVPDDHVLVRVARVLDLSWLPDEVADCYCADNGRPGIAPEVAVRLMLAGLLLGTVHDRRLMREAQVNLASRWFLGYGLHERLPDHSSLTRIRQRWGAARFRRIFQRTVRACVAAGIAKGEVVHVDSSLVRADVSWDAVARRHAEAILAANGDEASRDGGATKARRGWGRRGKERPRTRPAGAQGERGVHQRPRCDARHQSSRSTQRARLQAAQRGRWRQGRRAGRRGHDRRGPRHHDRRCAAGRDPGGHRRRDPDRDDGWGVCHHPDVRQPRGTGYRGHRAGQAGTAAQGRHPGPPLQAGCQEPDRALSQGPDPEAARQADRKGFQAYRAQVRDCRACPLRAACVSAGMERRAILLHKDHPALLRARRKRARWAERERALYAQHRCRVEGIHGEAKTWHGLARAVRRGLADLQIQAYLTAAVINLKRLAAAFIALILAIVDAYQHPIAPDRALRSA